MKQLKIKEVYEYVETHISIFHQKRLDYLKSKYVISFIHSLNTNFGTSIFEPVALALASSSFTSAASQQTAGTQISSGAHKVIQNIMDSTHLLL